MKSKMQKIRDKHGYANRASCLCFKSQDAREILLVSSSNSLYIPWKVPGGKIEPDEHPCSAALRESFEEAGAVGKLLGYLGVYYNSATKTRTFVYTMVVDNLTEEYDNAVCGHRRCWFPVDEARIRLSFRHQHQANWLDCHLRGQRIDCTFEDWPLLACCRGNSLLDRSVVCLPFAQKAAPNLDSESRLAPGAASPHCSEHSTRSEAALPSRSKVANATSDSPYSERKSTVTDTSFQSFHNSSIGPSSIDLHAHPNELKPNASVSLHRGDLHSDGSSAWPACDLRLISDPEQPASSKGDASVIFKG